MLASHPVKHKKTDHQAVGQFESEALKCHLALIQGVDARSPLPREQASRA
jgi:hypothetical protein